MIKKETIISLIERVSDIKKLPLPNYGSLIRSAYDSPIISMIVSNMYKT
ncbi:hypothetical protein SAMN04487777_102609 [Priestia aryabhattai B8W22]|nr:hypothetical protein SAMN04487777_102609 [Priestia aryabhattai B8W22]